ncbi:hypothetical protein SDJN02_06904, partial [Cucurbita argyrosperma subsp. argyrosperma]
MAGTLTGKKYQSWSLVELTRYLKPIQLATDTGENTKGINDGLMMKQLQENIRIVKVAIKLTAAIEDEEASEFGSRTEAYLYEKYHDGKQKQKRQYFDSGR